MSNQTEKDGQVPAQVSDLLPKVGEPRRMWIARVRLSLVTIPSRIRKWLASPASRITLKALVMSTCILASGCATNGPRALGIVGGAVTGFTLYHNYKVAESERWEKEEVAAGRTPLRQSNMDLIREDPVGYSLAAFGGAAVGGGAVEWAAERAEGDDVVNNSTTINNPPPDPVGVEPVGVAGAEARKRRR